jgi:hypothetical protein
LRYGPCPRGHIENSDIVINRYCVNSDENQLLADALSGCRILVGYYAKRHALLRCDWRTAGIFSDGLKTVFWRSCRPGNLSEGLARIYHAWVTARISKFNVGVLRAYDTRFIKIYICVVTAVARDRASPQMLALVRDRELRTWADVDRRRSGAGFCSLAICLSCRATRW